MGSTALTPPRALASIRQLCCLELSEEVLIPKLLDVLRTWVPFSTGHFVWSDPVTQRPINYVGDGIGNMAVMRHFFSHTSMVEHPGVAAAFPDAMRTQTVGTFGGERPETASYLNSSFYHEVMLPLQGRYVMYMIARDTSGRPRGMLSLMRHGGAKHYAEREYAKLLQIEPYLRYALDPKKVTCGRSNENCDSEGMAVIDPSGSLRYCDRQALILMWKASHEHMNSSTLFHMDHHGITPQLRQLYQRLAGVFDGRDVAPPVIECRNRWGRFVFRGRWLEGQGDRLIGVSVMHYIPSKLKTWQNLHRFGLAPRQQQVALLYCEGHTQTEISEQLGITRHTVSDYVAVIHERLGVGPGREAIRMALMAQSIDFNL